MQVGVPSAVGADTGVAEDGQQELISEVVLAKCSGAHWTDPPPVNSRDIGVAEIGVFRNYESSRGTSPRSATWNAKGGGGWPSSLSALK